MSYATTVLLLLLSSSFLISCYYCQDSETHEETINLSSSSSVSGNGQEGGENIIKFIKDFMRVQQEWQDENSLDSLPVATLDSNETDVKFKKFIEQHKYWIYSKISDNEYNLRRAIFAKNLIKIDLLNKLEQGTAVYGVNEFADLDEREFIRNKLGYRHSMRKNNLATESLNKVHFKTVWQQLLKEENKTELELDFDTPDSFDWRQRQGVVSSVKNQGSCGSCWAFSTTGNIEGQLKIKKNVTVALSEEELVDCDTVDLGCNGGLPQQAFDQVIKLGGLETEEDYPYNPRMSKKGCKMANKAKKYSITSFTDLPKDENKLKIWLYKRGPISIGVNAYAMQWYRHGVSHPWKILCNPMQLDHAVLIVGYGIEQSKKGPKPYWLIKNSWGSDWGEQGYYRLFRGKNVCGVAEDCSSAIINN